MKRFDRTIRAPLRLAFSRYIPRSMLLAATAVSLLLAIQAEVTAQEGSAPAEGIVPPPAGRDIETLRKLLGLPSAPAPAAPTRAPSEAQSRPEPQKPAPAAKAPPKGKPVAKPAAKKPAKPVVKAQKPAAPAAEKAEEAEEPAPVAQDEVEETGQVADEDVEETDRPAGTVQGSVSDVPTAGTVISTANVERWKHLLGPSIQWAVSRGATLPVVDPTPVPLEPFREEATRRYSPQVTLSPDKNSMRNYVAGVPFPLVTDDDPDVAIKMMFNFESRLAVDDVALRNFSCDTGVMDQKRGLQLERHYVVDSFRRLFYVSRFHFEPKPTWKTPDSVRYREMLGPLHEPFDLKGAGFTYIRFLDPGRHDDSWLYFPQLKRVRRLSTAQRSEGVFGQDVDLDSYGGYAGNPAWSHWTYLGRKTVLGVTNARNYPAKFQKPPADFFPDDAWEPREVFVLLAVSKLGGYNFGQRVLYLDRESLFIPYTEIYDLNGALWKGLIQTWQMSRTTIPGAEAPQHDYEQFLLPSLSMFDIQNDHLTRCFLPSADEKGGWHFNVGTAEGTTEEIFSVSHFIEIGR